MTEKEKLMIAEKIKKNLNEGYKGGKVTLFEVDDEDSGDTEENE